MKQYIYSPAEIGLSQWPSGTLRLEGIEVTTNPDEADVFVCPGSLALFRSATDMDRFPYIKGRENRHVFFDCSDETADYNKPCIFLLCNLRPFMRASNPNAVNFAWPVEDMAECIPVPESGFLYDVSCQAWSSTQTRIDAARSCQEHPGLRSDIALYPDFTGYLHDRTTNQWNTEGLRRRSEFRRSMKESRLALCPESIPGVFPYRFFEAMSAGRAPILVASDVVFPFRDEIPYEDFILHIERNDAPRAGEIVREFLDRHDDYELIDMGNRARHYWEKYLDSRNWPSLHAYAVMQQLEARACASRV